ncbi:MULTISPECIES: 5-formyltetrahydrofolate cyclo-ligase [unclassified Helicobacter]|uniref:5-formyltetrahydrofolate cyclo-ligase n=1 Tax=unclassified Helicobacter TaxID=2593540 RepID=UPI000CF15764|nr:MULTISPECIES: 5-formyltetrahydrofolate cyclo-ligase [unclassified Helicobacter]
MDTKEKFRKFCKSSLERQSHQYHSKKYQVNQALFLLIKQLKAKNILLYCPLKLEIDIFPLIYKLKKQGYKLFIPKVTGVSFAIVEFSLPLIKNKYGILECKTRIQNPKKIDVMITPVLGIDRTFRRIGFGKGMYDRFFAALKIKPKVIFITKNLYFSKEILTQDHDIRGDFLFCSQIGIKRERNDHLYCYKLPNKRMLHWNHHILYH